MDFTNIAVLTSIVVALSEVIKQFKIDAKLIPIINMLIGMLLGVSFMGVGVKEGAMYGVIIGLTASGLYSGVKHTKEFMK